MSESTPPLVERIVTRLREAGAPRSSADLAREFLGTGLLDESSAARIIDPVLEADERLERTRDGWLVRASASRYSPDDAPLSAARAVLFAPRHPHVHARTGDRPGDGPPRYAVALGGEAEAARHALRSGTRPLRPVVDLGRLARRWRGYTGPTDALRIAAHCGCRVVEGDTASAMAGVVAACWSSFVDALALEGVTHVSDVARLVEERLEAADFRGKEFGPAELDALPDAPGVYEFDAASGDPLYVGQSSCLAARVRSYFTGPPRDGKDRVVRREATALVIRPAASAPDALIDEMRRIARLAPRLNSRRPVREEGAEEGIVLAPRFAATAASPGGWIWFAIAGGRLAGRGSLLPGRRRAATGARAAVAALTRGARFAGTPPHEAALRREAVLVDAWRRASSGAPWLRLAIDGSARDLEERLASLATRDPA